MTQKNSSSLFSYFLRLFRCLVCASPFGASKICCHAVSDRVIWELLFLYPVTSRKIRFLHLRQKQLNLSVALLNHCINLQSAFNEQQIIDSLEVWSVRAACSFTIRDTWSEHSLPTGGYGLDVYNCKVEVTCHENQSLPTPDRIVVVC